MPARLTAVPDGEPDESVMPDEPVPAVPDGAAPDTAAAAPSSAAPAGSSSGGPDHDAAWFEALVRTHGPAVHRYLVRRAGGGEAEDLTADVLVVAWRRRADVPDEAALAWLYRTAGFVLANHRRKGRPIPVSEVPDEAADDDPAVSAVRDEQVRLVLAALSPRDRQILFLNAWEGLAGEELARVLGIGRGGADAALSRARSRLTEAWAQLVG